MSNKEETKTYNIELQKLLISDLISSNEVFSRCQNIIDPLHWNDRLRPAVRFILDYAEKYRSVPTPQQVKATTSIELSQPNKEAHVKEWFLDNIEEFCRHKAMENLILDGPKLLEEGRYAEIENRSKNNMMISLQKDLGTDYFLDPLERLKRMRDKTGTVSTGWKDIDKILGGGINRGELTFFAGGPGCVTAGTIIKIVELIDVEEYTGDYTFLEREESRLQYLRTFYSLNQLKGFAMKNKGYLSKLVKLTQPKLYNIEHLSAVNHGKNILVDSPDGWVKCIEWVEKDPKDIIEVKLANGLDCKASFDHLFLKKDLEWAYAKDLNLGELLETSFGLSPIVSLTNLPKEPVYDLSVDHVNHRYYTNGMVSHNTGKSLFMQNLGLNLAQQGLNIMYISLELSEELIGLRFDSMLTETSTPEIFKNMENIALRLGMINKKSKNDIKLGHIQIKKMNGAGTKVNDIRAYLKEFELQTNIKVDVLIVDYLDLLYPNSSKVDINSSFNKDKYTSEELRALCGELGLIGISASQINREGTRNSDFEASHIAGGISKMNTADNLLAIYTNATLREKGLYEIQFLKTRSSNGTGMKTLLSYSVEFMRITNAKDSEEVTKVLDIPKTSKPGSSLDRLKSRLPN